MSVGDLCDAGEEQPVGRKSGRQIAELFERFDQLAELRRGNLAGRLEILAADQEVIGAMISSCFKLLTFIRIRIASSRLDGV